MRPSQYHYIKRMWTRNLYKRSNKGFLSSMLIFLAKVILFISLIGIVSSLGLAFLCFLVSLWIIYMLFKLVIGIIKKNPNVGNNSIEHQIVKFQTNDEYYAKKSLERAKYLAEIINTTSDKDVFEYSLSEIKKELISLKKYEATVNFSGSTPSKDLKKLQKSEHIIREKFKERLRNKLEEESKKKNKSAEDDLDFEKFMVECNSILEKEDIQNNHDEYLRKYK